MFTRPLYKISKSFDSFLGLIYVKKLNETKFGNDKYRADKKLETETSESSRIFLHLIYSKYGVIPQKLHQRIASGV